MAGLIAMTSVFVVVSIEMFFAAQGAGHTHGSEYDTLPQGTRDEDVFPNGRHPAKLSRTESWRPFRQEGHGSDNPAEDIVLYSVNNSSESLADGGAAKASQANGTTMIPQNKPYQDEEDQLDLDFDEFDPTTSDSTGLLPSHSRQRNDTSFTTEAQRSHSHSRQHLHHDADSPQNPQKMLLQCLLLEAGILFHSVFIGMALSVATGTPFLVLLVAISFHQTFEGLALGSRIAAIPSFGNNSPKPWLMALAYGTTTPVGQAIGLFVHNLYDPASQTGLLMVGLMNAISSGLLLFAGLVELLAEDFLSDRSYEVLKGKRRLEACFAVAGGGALMALVGAWA